MLLAGSSLQQCPSMADLKEALLYEVWNSLYEVMWTKSRYKSELSLAGSLNVPHHSRPLAIRDSDNQHVQKVE